jgi:HAD superfamily hydrolase (TIGR01509 family)
MPDLKAIIFDCDGVLAETEKDGHRVAFNRVFKEENLGVVWEVEEYGELVEISGGKERMKHYFEKQGGLNGNPIDDELIARMHKRKTDVFTKLVDEGRMPPREGIARLIDDAYAKGIRLFVCSTSSEQSVVSLIKALFGEDRYKKFEAILAGDIVKAKKPAPDIYNLVKERYGLRGGECVVIEDTRNGLLAACGAGMHCVATVSFYSGNEDFKEADLVVSSLGDPGGEPIRVLRPAPALSGRALAYVTVEDLGELVK